MILPETLIVKIEDTRSQHPGQTGKPDKCFYCPAAIGTEHAADCVIPNRTVVLKMEIEYVTEVPRHWTAEDIELQRNLGSWCSDNALAEIERFCAKRGCLCNHSQFTYLREATADDLPTEIKDEIA